MYPLFVYSGSAIMKLDHNNIINKVDQNASSVAKKVENAQEISNKLKEISK